MFVDAIEKIHPATKPVVTITRNYKETLVRSGGATIFIINENGDAVTCKHVADLLLMKDQINTNFQAFKEEKSNLPRKDTHRRLRELEAKYGYNNTDATIQLQWNIYNVTDDETLTISVIKHPTLDLAVIQFPGIQKKIFGSHVVFAKDMSKVKPGKYLCRLGYPFPEFTNYAFDPVTDNIVFTNMENINCPWFPFEGMMTRRLNDKTGKQVAIEMSTPGLKGQSGGPLFNENGLVCGMQSLTKHMHLGFDMKNRELPANGATIKVTSQPLLHLGECIHGDVIKEFLREKGIPFHEA